MVSARRILAGAYLSAAEAAQLDRSRKYGAASAPSQVNFTVQSDDNHLPAVNIAIGVVSLIIAVALLALAVLAFLRRHFFAAGRVAGKKSSIVSSTSVLLEFSFRALAAATSNFSEKIGAGILGSVYKGVLSDSGTLVVVKKLESYNGSDKDFRSCVFDIGVLSHESLVKLCGFCAESGAPKMLVYEFLPNGSLDKFLFEDESQIDWKFRYALALSIARGVAYLHQQQVPVIHGNLKIENVLLDSHFRPKISDTGLSTLVDRRRIKSALSSGHGVHGYFSPEWIADSPLTTKSDVYSFGMVLLEVIAGRRIIDLSRRAEQWNLVEWSSRQVQLGNYGEIADARLSNCDPEQLRTAIDVALCCIKDEAKSRPLMSKVVQMLEEALVPAAPAIAVLARTNSA